MLGTSWPPASSTATPSYTLAPCAFRGAWIHQALCLMLTHHPAIICIGAAQVKAFARIILWHAKRQQGHHQARIRCNTAATHNLRSHPQQRQLKRRTGCGCSHKHPLAARQVDGARGARIPTELPLRKTCRCWRMAVASSGQFPPMAPTSQLLSTGKQLPCWVCCCVVDFAATCPTDSPKSSRFV